MEETLPVCIAVSELYETAMRQNGGLMYSLSVDVRMRVDVARRDGGEAVRRRYYRVVWQDVRTVQLKCFAIGRTDLQYKNLYQSTKILN